MASLTAKKINGRTYYYLRECAWVDGRPKIVRQKYLGTADAIAAAFEGTSAPGGDVRPEAQVLEFGAVAALYDLAERLGVVEIIDRHVPKQDRGGPSVGTYLLLAALNRCAAPTSKAQLASWYEGTALPRWLKVKPSQLSSQRFWDNMSRVGEEAIVAIERQLAERVFADFELDRACLFYDGTNFFTFIDSFNERSSLAQRGKCKHGRANLRIVGLGLLVTSDFQIPLFHHLYAGNEPDVKAFRKIRSELVERYRLVARDSEHITLVFDKGNNAVDTIQDLVDNTPFHVIGSLVPTQHEDLLATPKGRLKRLDKKVFEADVRAYRTKKEVYGRELTVLVTWNEKLFDAQTKTIEREAGVRGAKLAHYQRYLARWQRGKGQGPRPSIAATKKAVSQILKGRHMKNLFEIEITKDASALPLLRYRFDPKEYRRLKRTLFGKTLIFTDNDSWTDEKIVLGYRGQHFVESAFRQMNDAHHVTFRPTFHWTDQKLRVHAFYCVLALLLCCLLRRELSRKGFDLSVNRMLDTLATIREIHVLISSRRGRPRTKRVRSKLDTLGEQLFDALELGSRFA